MTIRSKVDGLPLRFRVPSKVEAATINGKRLRHPDGHEITAGELVEGKTYIVDLETGTVHEDTRKTRR